MKAGLPIPPLGTQFEEAAGCYSPEGYCDPGRGRQAGAMALGLMMAMLTGLGAGWAQDERRLRVPVLGKIAGGSAQLAFSGRVQSVDMQRKLLNVNTVEGGNTEIFHIKKDVPVSAADGTKLKLTDLTPGLHVIVYFEKKDDRRIVKDIVVLGTAPSEEGKKSRSPS